jgi:dihydroorotate dehydrogenase (NAD+) catalytic subunit
MVVNFAGLKLNTPYLAASGCWGYGWEGEEYFPGQNWGAVVSKTITLEKREGNPPPRIFEVNDSVINRVGLQNCGLDNFIKNELPKTRCLPYPVIVSIFGNNLEEWTKLVDGLTKEKVAAFELNFSCPNIKGEKMVKNIHKCCHLIGKLRKITTLPIIAKINALDNPVKLCSQLKKSGINGIVCSNTFPSIFVLDGQLYEGGLSGPAIKPVVLRTIKQIADKVDIDIAACGGIKSHTDIMDYKQTGAKVFVLGSILLLEPEIINTIVKSEE